MSKFRTSDDEENEVASDIEEEEEEEEKPQKAAVPQKIELQPSDFYFGAALGEGAYARVVHAKSKKQGTEFAIKIMDKAHIKRENKVKNVLMERKILTMVSHPLIIKFHFSFQDPGYLYMVMDLAPGGILLDLINSKQSENQNKGVENQACDLRTTQFYTAEIIEALEYLHNLGIIHRDLKPENVLLDRVGHIKIGDFGTSAICTDNQSPRTSFVGTQDYVSPEVLSGERKATKASDLWAVGCMIYQMITGISPFRGATEYLTFETIMGHCKGTNPIPYPATICEAAQDLIGSLLKSNETERLGAGEDIDSDNGYPKLKSHPFFEGIDFKTLIDMTPPFTPDASKFPDPNNMRDGAEDDWLLEGEATPITAYTPQEELLKQSAASDERRFRADSVVNRIWDKFLADGEKQVFTSTVYKRKGLFSKKRQLILTDRPRLIYVDPDSMELKGEIPWTRSHPVSCQVKNSKEFDVKCSVTQRAYHLSDSEVGSQAWANFINAVLDRDRSLSSASSSPNPSSYVYRDS